MKKTIDQISTIHNLHQIPTKSRLKQIKAKSDKIMTLNDALKGLAQTQYPGVLSYCYVINIRKDHSISIATAYHSVYGYLYLNREAIKQCILRHYPFRYYSDVHFTYQMTQIPLAEQTSSTQYGHGYTVSNTVTRQFEDLYQGCPNKNTKLALMKFLAKHGAFENNK